MKSQGFKFTKVLNHGTDNPIINRLSFQFFELFKTNLINLSDKKIEKIKELLHECTLDLIKAQELFNNYLEKQNKTIKEIIDNENFKIQDNIIQYDDPSYELNKYFEDFLIRNVIALRKTIKIAECVFDQEFDGPKDLLKHLQEVFVDKEEYIKMLEEDSKWFKELYDFRGEVEHSKLEITNFELFLDKNDKPLVKKQILVDKNCTLEKYMDVTLYNVFSYCEDFTAMLLKLHCSEKVRIIQIPEEQRKNNKNFKYTFDLCEDLKSKIFNDDKG
ncbi:hypothetical protein HSACCH_01058 [Halanaerobium saccharolyticum subsp. saccharolyticum DSM 6643]|uniref:Cthe-2314-like HEPN domain-containing protein n=1 Tax=Halanaerobium saccharolyticum subsp. saccharolyticum DSM 6643 TaxID=1293054 RepID=M5E0B9_9FIRM|nr:hypothetical protein [Halanaerobium saccharolyticum]CCU79056.1 hypothetical protein HSACCH_01058 [Halanaerobium saccharolyticum subsp. saccharolyticum DSM 6643]